MKTATTRYLNMIAMFACGMQTMKNSAIKWLKSDYAKTMGISIVFGALFWIIDGCFEYAIFHKNLKFMLQKGPETLTESLFTQVPPHSLFIRLSFFLASCFGGALLSLFLFKKNRLQATLRQREETFSGFFNQGNIGMAITSADKFFIQANKKFCRMLDYGKEELLKKTWIEITHPDDVDADVVLFEDLAAGEINHYEMEKRLLKKDGTVIYTHLTISCTRSANGNIDQVLATHQDITERKKAEEELRRSGEKYRKVVDTSPYGIQLTDLEGKIVFGNPAYHRIHAYAEGELVGKHFWELMTDGANKIMAREFYQKAIKEKSPPKIHFNKDKTKDGREIETRVDWDYIRDSKGDPEGILSFVSDITEQKKLESRLRQAQKMESIGNLAGGIAHDFNNLLFPILGLSEMLLDDLPPDSSEHRKVQQIFRSGNRGADLVKQILAFSRRSEQKTIPVEFQSILKEVFKLCRSTIPSDIELIQNIQADCGMIEADPTQLHQIAMNLITNAYHAVEDAGGQISVELKETELAGDTSKEGSLESNRYAMLTVSDTGSGIDPALMDKIFDPYFTTKKQGKGTGLGLAVVYGIVREYKGEVRVYSEVGRGTAFHVCLPIKERSAEMPAAKMKIDPKGDERILLVDDESSIVRLEKLMLERLGYRVTTRMSSVDALEAFKANPDAYDLVVTDMNMPNMTGTRLARELMAIKPDIPVLMCTGFSERITANNAASMGIKGFLMKPVAKSEMACTVRKVLDEAKNDASVKTQGAGQGL